MRIAVIGVRGFPGLQGGVEKHCEDLYPRLPGDVHVSVYRRKPYLTAESFETKYKNIDFVDLPSTRIKGFEAVFHTFISAVHAIFYRPDLVHVHNMGPGLFIPLLKLAGLRVVMTYHSVNYEQKKWGMLARFILRLCERISLGTADRVIFVNKFRMNIFSEKIRRKSVYIPNGIACVAPSTGVDFLDKHGIKRGEYLLAVGRMSSEKGFDTLIRAAVSLSGVKQVVIAGASDHDTSYYDYLRSLDTEGKVVFTGFTKGEDLRQLYSHARLFVLPSTTEGFPLVMLEAMAYGLPMVVSDISATHLIELPADDYFEAGNVADLTGKIEEKLLRTPCGTRAKYDLNDYRWENVSVDTYKVLKEAAENR